ncbi:D-alanine--D-alanine ligase family protein [Cryobacterium sp. BB736]|uniref:D-alanine--D-alanine ligase family protein n=1 Tax=Cryobacterium sp. BB736 TaxID=2746963 RepID=UPI0018742716
MTDKTTVVLVFGGRSSEHAISCATAGGVLAAIDRDRYNVIPVGITTDGAFVLEEDDPERLALGAELPTVIDNGTRVLWPESAATRELRVVETDGSVRSLGDIDIAFPILHGRFGEDGTIQGMFELIGLPYVGNGVLASAIAMDKHMTKSVLQSAGVEVAPWVAVTEADWRDESELWGRRARGLALPLFVKPARAGSSVGVTKVEDWDDLDAALDVAFAEDRTAIIEQAIVGREIECGVLSGRDGGAPRVSLPGEIRLTGREFYDFDAKYRDAPGVELVCPVELNEGQQRELERVATRAFRAIGASGLARIDFFLTPSSDLIVNEVNTLPGFTPISMFPKCWIASGIEYPELISELIELGFETVR